MWFNTSRPRVVHSEIRKKSFIIASGTIPNKWWTVGKSWKIIRAKMIKIIYSIYLYKDIDKDLHNNLNTL
jgi:hypothetical protein